MKTRLLISLFTLDIGSFDNISNIEKKLPELNSFKLGSHDSFALRFSKASVSLELKENNIEFIRAYKAKKHSDLFT